MSNLPETDNFDSGVYEIQSTDPVQGATSGGIGIANQGAQNLTNRTRWLYVTLSALQTVVNGLASLVSPIFTGTPEAPTAAAGTTGAQLATCGFAQSMLNGVTIVNVAAGTTVLTAAQYGQSIILVEGNPTGPATVLVPTGVTGRWIVQNAVGSGQTVAFGVVGGTSETIEYSGFGREFFSNGTNIYDARTDFPSPALLGTPTTPTPTVSGQVANKGYVDSSVSGLNFTGVSGANGYQYLPNGHVRVWGTVSFTAVASSTTTLAFTMPIAFTAIPGNCGCSFGGAGPPAGVGLSIENFGLAQVKITVVCPGAISNPLAINYWAEGN